MVNNTRKPKYGVGINDSTTPITKREYLGKIEGKHKYRTIWQCPFYIKWSGILERVYCKKKHMKNPTYKDCTLQESWLIFSNFKSWMEKQDWKGKEIDKDILIQGNKHYSEETCVFVTTKINNFLLACDKSRGNYMLGVHLKQRTHDFVYGATCQNPITNRCEHIGYFDTELKAHIAWKNRKYKHAVMLLDTEKVIDEKIREGILNRYN